MVVACERGLDRAKRLDLRRDLLYGIKAQLLAARDGAEVIPLRRATWSPTRFDPDVNWVISPMKVCDLLRRATSAGELVRR